MSKSRLNGPLSGLKNIIGSSIIEKDDGYSWPVPDSLAEVLALYFSDHCERPKDDPFDSELGWNKWPMKKTEEALELIAKDVEEYLETTRNSLLRI